MLESMHDIFKDIDFVDKITSDTEIQISPQSALSLVGGGPDQDMDLIFCANKIHRFFKRGHAFTCAIINAKSGLCAEDCAFCAQSAHHRTGIETYGLLDTGKIVDFGMQMEASGASHYSVVTSGSALNESEIETVCRAARILKEKSGLNLCASLGMLNPRAASMLKDAGITRYHHNLETARGHFDTICSTHDYDEDLATVRVAQAAGLQVCSGGIFGMGESWRQRVELAFTLKELDVDSIPINFLNPVPGTRLAEQPLLPPLEALKCIALLRLIHPRKDIPVCGGREVVLGDFQSWVFMAGANGLMIGNYLTTQGRDIDMDLHMITQFGMTHAKSRRS